MVGPEALPAVFPMKVRWAVPTLHVGCLGPYFFGWELKADRC